eukprot:CAMPEP_0116115012 /NCGR_PEP_ID=MMETSP0329-20121206/281_1 /TAXON_ID=697910 /ORGANISM="Pseudo-nitzschia arenysensis, Strain B593" /LENGTH=233 /DNA_ID=CAMNT_0003608419 /DNA_START=80 /DNA_END=779 /DNA_ORIENTATION=+
MDLFVVSSAFVLKSQKQCSDLYGTSFPRAIRYGDLDSAESSFGSALGSNFNENPESLAQPLPTSNDFMTPEEVVTTCMRYLQGKGEATPTQERAGLEICYIFSSDSCRMANGGSLESFLQRANNPVFQTMVGCAQWEVVNVGPEIAGTPTRGVMQTILVDVVPRLAEGGAQRNDDNFCGPSSKNEDRLDKAIAWCTNVLRWKTPLLILSSKALKKGKNRSSCYFNIIVALLPS